MAGDSAEVRSGLTIFLQKKSASRLKNTLFDMMPTLEFFFMLKGDKTGVDGLGRPKTGIMLSALNGVADARREKIFAEREYRPLIQISKPDQTDVKRMTDYDSDPTVTGWESNSPLSRFKQPVFKFCRKKMPWKIPHSEKRTALAGGGGVEAEAARLVNVYDAEVKTRMATFCEGWNYDLFGTGGAQGYPTDETDTTWDYIHSFTYALAADNTYGGVDRSLDANAWWRGITLGSTDSLAETSGTWEDRLNYLHYDKGLAAKGLGIELVLTTATQFKKAKAEAKAENHPIFQSKVPDYPEFGFKREIVCIYTGNRPVYIMYEPACPSGTAYFLSPSTWTVAIHPDSNFKIDGPYNQTHVEGGDEADTGTIAAEIMMACEVPSANAIWTDLT